MSVNQLENLIKAHIAELTIDKDGKIIGMSKNALKQLIGLKNGTLITKYFPDLELTEGTQICPSKNAHLIKIAKVDILKNDSSGFKIYFSSDYSHDKLQAEKQMNTAELAVLGELTAGIAHEISNPLTIIAGFAKHILSCLERENIESNSIEGKSKRIIETVKRITDIVSAMRKLAHGLKEQEPKVQIEIQNLLKEALILTTFKLATSNVALDIEEYNKSLTVECHPVQLVQVLMNLINNASDALEGAEKPQIKIEVAEQGENVVFKVKDSAGSLKPELYEKIFEQNVTTKEVGKGTGLGLYLSRKIVHSHNGSLKAYVKDGWTTFELTVPKVAKNKGVRAA